MTRRTGNRRAQTVPGLSDAYAIYAREFAEAWPTTTAVARADAAERGEPVELDGHAIWRALYGLHLLRLAARFQRDEGHYTLTAPDMLTPAG